MERLPDGLGHDPAMPRAGHGTVRPHPRRVSVVMPVRNAAETVADQLVALAAQTYAGDWELVIADNGSRDRTRDRVMEMADRLPLRVVPAAPRGVSPARNRGAAAATGELLLFCDADDVVAPDWIEQMVRAARHGEVVGGRLDPERLNPPDVRSSRPPPQGGGLARTHGLPYATGASLAVWADVLEELGGFDERLRAGGEETDFSWRAQSAGYRLVHAPSAITHYRYRTSWSRTIVQALRYGIADSMLARRHRHRLPRSPSLRRHVRPLRDLPQLLRGRRARRRWTWNAALRAGGILGALRPRTWLLRPLPPTPMRVHAVETCPPTAQPPARLRKEPCS